MKFVLSRLVVLPILPSAQGTAAAELHLTTPNGKNCTLSLTNDPPGDLTAAAQSRRGPTRVVAASRRNLAAVPSVHVCASVAWQHEPAF